MCLPSRTGTAYMLRYTRTRAARRNRAFSICAPAASSTGALYTGYPKPNSEGSRRIQRSRPSSGTQLAGRTLIQGHMSYLRDKCQDIKRRQPRQGQASIISHENHETQPSRRGAGGCTAYLVQHNTLHPCREPKLVQGACEGGWIESRFRKVLTTTDPTVSRPPAQTHRSESEAAQHRATINRLYATCTRQGSCRTPAEPCPSACAAAFFW